MNREKVTSREYKIMLKASRFIGDEQALLQSASQFWRDLREAVGDITLDVVGDLNVVDKRRTIQFYDTHEHRLRNNNYAFRVRQKLSSGKREVTLKFRHPDRYIAQDRNMDAAEVERGKTKFEEDIKPDFLKLYSFSTKQKVAHDLVLDKMDDPVSLFPDLERQLDQYDENETIHLVGGFTAYELVIHGAEFQLSDEPAMRAECTLSVWYDNQSEMKDQPLVVDFSFKYGDKQERYPKETAQRAYDLFQRIQQTLTNWVDPKPQTKTAYVYGRE